MNLLQNKYRKKFGLDIDHVNVQYFDTDVNEYVDLENESLVEEEVGKVLKVTVKKTDYRDDKSPSVSNHQTQQPTSCSTGTVQSQAPESPKPSTSVQQSELQSVTVQPPVPLHSPSTSAQPAPASTTASNSKKKWPRMYSFPVAHLPSALRIKLEDKSPMERIDRTRLLDTVYTDVTSYDRGLYPSADMYDQVVDSLLRQYPHLIEESGIPLHSVRVYWKERLKFKWGNERKSRDKNLPEVKAKKRKTVDSEPIEKGNVLTWGMANYLPPSLESEDDEATERHIQWLKTHYTRQEQDESLVNLKMKLCFPERRKDIVTYNMLIADILEKYPFMKERRQILLEFARLGPSFDGTIEDVFNSSLDEYSEHIVSLVKNRKIIPQLKEILAIIPVQRTEGERKYATKCAAILGSGQLFKEKIENIICSPGQQPKDSAVALVVIADILTMDSRKFELKVEGETVFACDTFLELFIGFLASIYCFNLAYPKPLVKTLTFFQHVFLKLNDGHLDKKIVSVTTELNRERTRKK